MRICVLGGTGFVGSRLVARLAAAGHTVRVPTRHRERARDLLPLPTVEVITADVHDPAMLRALTARCEVVVNLVGILNERGRDGAGFRHAHADLARKLVDAAARGGVRKIVQMSALRANARVGPSHYLKSKGEAEQAIAGNNSGIVFTILQPSVIFGPGDSFLNRFAGLLKMSPVLPLAMPAARFAPVHVDDVTSALVAAVTDPATDGRTLQLCGPESYTLKKVVLMVREALGLRRFVAGLPRWASRAMGFVMDFVPGKPFSSDNYRSLTVSSLCAEDGFAPLGIEPRSLELNLADCLDTLRSGGGPFDRFRREARG